MIACSKVRITDATIPKSHVRHSSIGSPAKSWVSPRFGLIAIPPAEHPDLEGHARPRRGLSGYRASVRSRSGW
jgi:hypothetical protein